MCYLPPNKSSRNIDADDFIDNLICQMHQYCKNREKCSIFAETLMLDVQIFTILLKVLIPYRAGMSLTLRTSNKYGELLCDV